METLSATPGTTAPQQAPRPVALRDYADLPGPRGLPLLGNALQMDPPRMHQQVEQWCREFGPMFKLSIGPRRLMVLGDHALIAGVLRDRPDGFARTSKLQEIWTELGLATGVFSANGDVWKRQRRMVMAGFDPAHVRGYYPAMQAVAQRLSARWQRAALAGQAIELQPELMRYTVDTIAGLAFGAEVDTLGSDGDVIQQHLDKLFPVVYRRLFAPLPLWRWLPSAADRELARAVVEVNRAIDGFIAQARARLQADAARRAAPPNLLEAMLVAADEPSSGIDDSQVAGNVLTMLLAGEDTTANTLAWMLHLLWRHPAALARAVDEVQRVVGDSAAPTMAQLARLDFIEACCFETMRLKPVGPLQVLQTIRDTTIGDVRVPAGVVLINAMRRDSLSDALIPHAAAFEPARWLESGSTAAQTAASPKRISMPFGAGPRICPGRYLALLEMKLAMATLLRDFEITAVDTPDGGEARELLQFTMAPVGLTMTLRARPMQPAATASA